MFSVWMCTTPLAKALLTLLSCWGWSVWCLDSWPSAVVLDLDEMNYICSKKPLRTRGTSPCFTWYFALARPMERLLRQAKCFRMRLPAYFIRSRDHSKAFLARIVFACKKTLVAWGSFVFHHCPQRREAPALHCPKLFIWQCRSQCCNWL